VTEAQDIAQNGLNEIYSGALQSAAGQVSDPEDPSLEEMIAGVGIFFRRLGAQRFEQMARDIAEAVIPPIGRREFEDLQEEVDGGEGVDPPRFDDAIDRFTSQRVPIFRGPVRQNTRSTATAAIEEAHGPDKSLEQTIQDARENLEGQAQQRSDTIGWTEVAAAAGIAILAAALFMGSETDTEFVKRWISQLDAKVRTPPESRFNHLEPHGQTVPIDRPFNISGEELMFPGDPSMGASLGNLIGCRCLPLPLPRSAVDESDILMT